MNRCLRKELLWLAGVIFLLLPISMAPLVCEKGGSQSVVESVSAAPTGLEYVNSTLWGNMRDVDVLFPDSIAYCAVSYGLAIVRLHDMDLPDLMGQCYLESGAGYGIDVVYPYAYVADGAGGLCIIDVSDPTQPELVGTWPTPPTTIFASDVLVAGNYAYVACGIYGLSVIDVSTASAPVEVCHRDTDGYLFGLDIESGYLFVSDGVFGIRSYSMSNPACPSFLDAYSTSSFAWDIKVSDTLAYVACADPDELEIVNVIQPSNMAYVGSIAFPRHAEHLAVSGMIAYVQLAGGDLATVDCSNAASPNWVDSDDVPGWGLNVTLVGDELFVTSLWGYCDQGFYMFTTSTPTNPVLIPGYSYSVPVYALKVVLSGDFAFIANNCFGLQSVEIGADELTPRGSVDLAGDENAVNLAVSGNNAYVAYSFEGLLIADISDPAAPSEVLQYTAAGGTYDVVVQGDYAYVAHKNSYGVEVLNISTPSSPVRETTIGSQAEAVGVAGDRLCYSNTSDILTAVDITDPTAPLVGGTVALGNQVYDIKIRDTLAYVAASYGGLKIINVKDYLAPAVVGSLPTGDYSGFYDIEIVGDYLYLGGFSKVVIVDISDVTSPAVLGDYYTCGYPWGLAFDAGRIIVADRHAVAMLDEPFTAGDADGNGIINISDAVYLITYIFGGGPPPDPLLAGDCDCNGIVNISDAVYLITYIFGGGPPPGDPDGNGVPDC